MITSIAYRLEWKSPRGWINVFLDNRTFTLARAKQEMKDSGISFGAKNNRYRIVKLTTTEEVVAESTSTANSRAPQSEGGK